MSIPGPCPRPGYPAQESATVRFFSDCHNVKLFEVSLAHVVLIVPLLLLTILIRRLCRG